MAIRKNNPPVNLDQQVKESPLLIAEKAVLMMGAVHFNIVLFNNYSN
jgi:hypothetical protein